MIWSTPQYPLDRRIARTGAIDMGAVFPPAGREKHWRWRFWLNGNFLAASSGRSGSEETAKGAVADRFRLFLEAAQLEQKGAP